MPVIRYIRKNDRLRLLLLALPFLAFILMFSYVPLAGWVYAFFRYRPGIPLDRTPFVGFDNFRLIFTLYRNQMTNVLRNTLIFSFLGLLMSPIPMFFAVLLNEIRRAKFKKLVQTTTTLPNFISWVIVFALSFAIFQDVGPVNRILLYLGLVDSPTMLLGNSGAVYAFQTILGLWKHVGWSAIIYFAAIAGIDSELYDAASVDGAGRLGKMLNITLPGLLPTYLVLLLLAIGNMLSVGFEQYFLFYNSLTARSIDVIDTYVYRVGLLNNDFSFGIAVGIFKTMISVILLFTANGIAKKVRGQSII